MNCLHNTETRTSLWSGIGVFSDVVGRLSLSVSERVSRIVSLTCAGVVGATILAGDPAMAGGVRQASDAFRPAAVADTVVPFADDVNKNTVLWEVTLAEGVAAWLFVTLIFLVLLQQIQRRTDQAQALEAADDLRHTGECVLKKSWNGYVVVSVSEPWMRLLYGSMQIGDLIDSPEVIGQAYSGIREQVFHFLEEHIPDLKDTNNATKECCFERKGHDNRILCFRMRRHHNKPFIVVSVTDVTVLREEEVRNNARAEEYKSIFSSAHDLLFITDSGAPNQAFPTVIQIWSTPLTMTDGIGCEFINQPLSKILHMEAFQSQVEVQQAIRIALQNGLHSVEIAVMVNGSPKTFFIDVQKLPNGTLRWRCTDMTVINALKKSKLIYDNIMTAFLETTQDGIVILDAEGRTVRMNPAIEKMLGYTSNDMLGQDFHSLFVKDADTLHRIRESFRMVREYGTSPSIAWKRIETRAFRADGTMIDIELLISATRVKGEWYIFGNARDITERKNFLRELRKQADLIEKMGEHTNEGMIVTFGLDVAEGYGGEKPIIPPRPIWNLSLERITGLSREGIEMKGGIESFLMDLNIPTEIEVAKGILIESLADNAAISIRKIITSERKGKYLRITVHPVVLYDGRPAHVSLVQDITREFRAQMDLYETKELALKTVQTAQTASENGRNQFLATMSHELRTPLNQIIGFSEMLSGQGFEMFCRSLVSSSDFHKNMKYVFDAVVAFEDIAQAVDELCRAIVWWGKKESIVTISESISAKLPQLMVSFVILRQKLFREGWPLMELYGTWQRRSAWWRGIMSWEVESMSQVLMELGVGRENLKTIFEYLSIIHDAGHTLLKQIKDILSIERNRIGSTELDLWPCELHRIVWRASVEHTNILTNEIQLGTQIIADQKKLLDLFINLINSAARHVRRERLHIHARQVFLHERDFVVVTIDDADQSIAPEYFTIAPEATVSGLDPESSEIPWAGLEFALARSIAERHGGHIQMVTRVHINNPLQRITSMHIFLPKDGPIGKQEVAMVTAQDRGGDIVGDKEERKVA